MAGEPRKFEWLEEFIILRIRRTFTLVIIGLVALFIIAFIVRKDLREEIQFIGAACGVGAGILSAYYLGRAIRVQIDQRDRALREDRIARAFGYVSRWNDPNFAPLRSKWRGLLNNLEGESAERVCSAIEADGSNTTLTVDILNFFEEIAYAARSEVADVDTLKNAFRGITIRYFSCSYHWIEKHRREKNRPLAFEHVQWLARKWEQ